MLRFRRARLLRTVALAEEGQEQITAKSFKRNSASALASAAIGSGGSHLVSQDNESGRRFWSTALVVPFLLLLLIGTVEFGIVAMGSIEVTNAASAGALYGAQNRANASDNAGITNAARNDAANVTSLNVTGVTQWCACENATAVSVSGAVNCTAFAPASCVSPSRIVEWVQVDTSAGFDPLFHYPGLPPTFTLRGRATMRVGQ